MNAHIRLVSSETVADDANNHDTDESAEGRDEAPIGLPEEGGSNRNDVLRDKPPLLVAEPEDRGGGARNAGTGSKNGVARLIALIWSAKKAPAPDGEDKNADGEGETVGVGRGEREEDATAKAADAPQEAGLEAGQAAVAERVDRPCVDPGETREDLAVAKAKRSVSPLNGALAFALVASVAIPAIVVLNWPRSAPQPVVEPGMLADGQTKVMAPSAALAKTPPREEPNVARDRPKVDETPRDELAEVLSLKGGEKVAQSAKPKADPPAAAQPPVASQAPEATSAASAPPTSALAPAASQTKPPAPIEQPKAVDAAQAPAPGAISPTHSAVAHESADAAPSEPGLGEAAKIEARLADLEMTVKDRSNVAHARLEAEKAETHTLEKIAELGALVTRLTGQVKDLQDKVQTQSTSAEEKFADLTRRVALGEANRAVASAENAAPAGSGAQEKGPRDDRTRIKVAAADGKRAYRIQAASPGLAMLAAVDGSPDDRPVEVAIGTELPGYGKVVSIEQHGEAWVVKADRGSIE